MREFFKRLVTLNRRDWLGMAGWAAVGLLVGLAALPVMVAREVWQWRRYKLPRFEWEDVVRYGAVDVLIGLTGLFCFGPPGLLGLVGVLATG